MEGVRPGQRLFAILLREARKAPEISHFQHGGAAAGRTAVPIPPLNRKRKPS
jgi:hypothetical protein